MRANERHQFLLGLLSTTLKYDHDSENISSELIIRFYFKAQVSHSKLKHGFLTLKMKKTLTTKTDRHLLNIEMENIPTL